MKTTYFDVNAAPIGAEGGHWQALGTGWHDGYPKWWGYHADLFQSGGWDVIAIATYRFLNPGYLP